MIQCEKNVVHRLVKTLLGTAKEVFADFSPYQRLLENKQRGSQAASSG